MHIEVSCLICKHKSDNCNSMHLVAKHFRHQDTKTQKLISANSFASCLGAFVAIYYPSVANPG